jgi:hypothetical protein
MEIYNNNSSGINLILVLMCPIYSLLYIKVNMNFLKN